MRKCTYLSMLMLSGTILSTNVYASTPASEKHEFKSTEREINFEIERKSEGIVLYIQSKFFNTYDEILIERAGEANGGYAACKTISLSKTKIDGDYYVACDKFPLPAQTEVSYRIKSIAKDGTTKTFPPVQLAARPK